MPAAYQGAVYNRGYVAAPVEICDLDLVLEAVFGRVLVDLRCDGKTLGELNAYHITRDTLARGCRKDLARATRHVGLPLEVYVVFWSRLNKRLRGAGLGTALYLAAAEGASRLGGVLVQNACYDDTEQHGDTSDLARNVWMSNRFREHVVVFGDAVGYLPQSRWGAAQSMLRFGQLDVPIRNTRRR